jgi:hypothetical protein
MTIPHITLLGQVSLNICLIPNLPTPFFEGGGRACNLHNTRVCEIAYGFGGPSEKNYLSLGKKEYMCCAEFEKCVSPVRHDQQNLGRFC